MRKPSDVGYLLSRVVGKKHQLHGYVHTEQPSTKAAEPAALGRNTSQLSQVPQTETSTAELKNPKIAVNTRLLELPFKI